MDALKGREPLSAFFCLGATRFGPVAVVWADGRGAAGVRRILLPKPGESAERRVLEAYPEAKPGSHREIGPLLDRIAAFVGGADERFLLDEVRLDLCSAFQQAVLRAEHGIPRGRVSTYRLIARKLGDPNAARAVGTALATNPFPIVIPCHRAIRSDGSLGGFQGGLTMKRALLRMEGIAFRDRNRVETRSFFYGGPGTLAR